MVNIIQIKTNKNTASMSMLCQWTKKYERWRNHFTSLPVVSKCHKGQFAYS